MSVITPPPVPSGPFPVARNNVIVQEKVLIPGWIDSLESYRAWAHSDAYPESGWVSYLNGTIWVDMEMEEFFTHNQVKGSFTGALVTLTMREAIGRFVPDRMLLTNVAANLSTEPDGLFFLWATLQSERIRLLPGKKEGYMELEGTPDMVLEIVSKYSERKDTKILRELYWKAAVPEYWLVDVRKDDPR